MQSNTQMLMVDDGDTVALDVADVFKSQMLKYELKHTDEMHIQTLMYRQEPEKYWLPAVFLPFA